MIILSIIGDAMLAHLGEIILMGFATLITVLGFLFKFIFDKVMNKLDSLEDKMTKMELHNTKEHSEVIARIESLEDEVSDLKGNITSVQNKLDSIFQRVITVEQIHKNDR